MYKSLFFKREAMKFVLNLGFKQRNNSISLLMKKFSPTSNMEKYIKYRMHLIRSSSECL